MTEAPAPGNQRPANTPEAGAGFDALVLAGGRGTRLGGADKAALTLHGQRLVDRVITAARSAGANQVVVIGPPHAGTEADRVVREEPAYGGPLAALAAGIRAVDSEWVMVLGCDLQHPLAVATALRSASGMELGDGALLEDEEGHLQWLAGYYRTAAITAVCKRLGDEVANAPLRRVLGELELHRIPVGERLSDDIDTPQALARARQSTKPVEPKDARGPGQPGAGSQTSAPHTPN